MVTPINNYVLVEVLPKHERIVKEVVTNDFDIQGWAKVISVAPGTIDDAGSSIPIPVDPENIVYCHRHGMMPYTEKQYVVSEHDLMLKVVNNKVQPLGNRILIELIDDTQSGIKLFRLSGSKKVAARAKVVRVGTGWKDMLQNPIPFHVKEGDTVIIDKNQLAEIPGEDAGVGTIHLISQGDILLKEDAD